MARQSLLSGYVLAIFSILCLSVSAGPFNLNPDGTLALMPRQSNPNTNMAMKYTCQDYATIANLSVIGLNSTYRAAFLRSSPLGTDPASAILDTRSPMFMMVMFDDNLNSICGNLSEIAIAGAADNFTRGIVAEFEIKEAPGVTTKGLHVPVIVIVVLFIMCGTFVSL